jgi:hypothetical protein
MARKQREIVVVGVRDGKVTGVFTSSFGTLVYVLDPTRDSDGSVSYHGKEMLPSEVLRDVLENEGPDGLWAQHIVAGDEAIAGRA